MRLTAEQQQVIAQPVRRHAGANAVVRVYGSRLRNDRRGGDIDLMVERDRPLSALERADLQIDVEGALQYPVDVLYHQTGTPLTAFQTLALASSKPLPSSHA